jgi:RNA polymerase sigma-70 factor, ECF subfamily
LSLNPASRVSISEPDREGSVERTSAFSVSTARDEAEADLVKAAQRDPAEFAALYRLFLQRVYRYVRVRVRDDEAAADLTQQVFLKALQSLPSYQERGLPFAAWLFRIARNHAVDAARRRRDTSALGFVPEAALSDSLADPERAALRRESLERLRGFVAELDPDERELLALRFAARLSSREIAPLVGKHEEAVKKRLTRLLHRLKESVR